MIMHWQGNHHPGVQKGWLVCFSAYNSTIQSKITGQARPVCLLFSTGVVDGIPQNSYYGDNNETPTMPAT
jgi:hypothetical protein